MHFLKNIFANSLGQTYLILSSLIATPFFLKILGDEAFGIIGFYIVLMTWMNFLDIGFTPAFGRLIAYEKDKPDSDKKVASVFKSLETIFLFLSLLLIIISIFQSKNISQEWINSVSLSNDLIDDSIKIMFLIIALRWFRVLYISGINGLEDQVWLSSANAFFATLRNFIIIPLLIIFPNITFYFIYQLILIFIELVIFRIRLTKNFSISEKYSIFHFNWNYLKTILPFAASSAYGAIIFIGIGQIDRLILSGMLDLVELGYFSLGIMIVTGILTINSSITNALNPRLTSLYSQNKILEFDWFYRRATELQVILVGCIVSVICLFSYEIIFAWTGNENAALWNKDIIVLYAIAGAFQIFFGASYSMQVAYGDLSLAVKGVTISALIFLPCIVFATLNYGAYGAGMTWCILRLVWGLFWSPIVHKNFLESSFLSWLCMSIFLQLSVISAITFIIYVIASTLTFNSRVEFFVMVMVFGFILFLFTILIYIYIRKIFFKENIFRQFIK